MCYQSIFWCECQRKSEMKLVRRMNGASNGGAVPIGKRLVLSSTTTCAVCEWAAG